MWMTDRANFCEIHFYTYQFSSLLRWSLINPCFVQIVWIFCVNIRIFNSDVVSIVVSFFSTLRAFDEISTETKLFAHCKQGDFRNLWVDSWFVEVNQLNSFQWFITIHHVWMQPCCSEWIMIQWRFLCWRLQSKVFFYTCNKKKLKTGSGLPMCDSPVHAFPPVGLAQLTDQGWRVVGGSARVSYVLPDGWSSSQEVYIRIVHSTDRCGRSHIRGVFEKY